MLGLYVLLNLVVLIIVAWASAARGWRLALMLFILGFVVGLANNLLEAIVFGVISVSEAMTSAAAAGPLFAVLAIVATFIARFRSKKDEPRREGGFTPITLLGCVAAYEVLYWTAGTLVFPYIADFYATRTLPPAYLVASLQIVRSLIFVGAVYPLLRSGLRAAPVVLALVYGIIAGIAPLLPDNPYMPPDIRFYHAIEVTVSNTLFGLFVGWLFNRRTAMPAAPAQA